MAPFAQLPARQLETTATVVVAGKTKPIKTKGKSHGISGGEIALVILGILLIAVLIIVGVSWYRKNNG